MKVGIEARGTTMSTTSCAPAAFASQNAFSRASMICVAAPPGSTYTSIAPSSLEVRPERVDVGLEAVLVRVLQDDHEVREGAFLHVVGHAELEVVGGRHRRHGQQVDVLEHHRADARVDDPRHRGGHLVEGRERREHRGANGEVAGAA